MCGWVGDAELRSVLESEELLVNVAATINNLSFYQEESSAIKHNQLIISKCKLRERRSNKCKKPVLHSLMHRILCALVMMKLVLSSCMNAMLEATRVYGNLSNKSKDVRDFIMQNKGKNVFYVHYRAVILLYDTQHHHTILHYILFRLVSYKYAC